MITLTPLERERLRQFGCEIQCIEALCHKRPKWIDDLMKFYDDLDKPDSNLVQEALLSGCPVCNAKPGDYCRTCRTVEKEPVPLYEAYGDYVHMIRADGLPYTSAEGKLRRPKKAKTHE